MLMTLGRLRRRLAEAASTDEDEHEHENVLCPACGHDYDSRDQYDDGSGLVECPVCGYAVSESPVDSRDPDDVTLEEAFEEIVGMMPPAVLINGEDTDGVKQITGDELMIIVDIDPDELRAMDPSNRGRNERSSLIHQELSSMLIDELGYKYQGYNVFIRGVVTVELIPYGNSDEQWRLVVK